MDYEEKDVRVGMECVAPMKPSETATKREYMSVVVERVDGNVVVVATTNTKKVRRSSFTVRDLRRPGTKTPPMGIVR